MEIDSPDGSSGSMSGNQNENGFNLYSCSVGDGGMGLPYAPNDWPNPGDRWTWKVGQRIATSGYFQDRYLYPPKHLRDPRSKKHGLASLEAVRRFFRLRFPEADVDAFLASFCWKIPSNQLQGFEVTDRKDGNPPREETTETSVSDSHVGDLACKAGNRSCSSLVADENSSEVMFCDICCSEPGFCRDCCCILCCKKVTSAYDGYSYIRCEALVNGSVCGHVAHINCALRAYMAGTVGGTIGLNAEYYCRRCDSKSDLVSHVRKLLKKCESMNSRKSVEMILNLGICILRDTERANGKKLFNRISSALSKLRNGADFEDIWKEEDGSEVNAGGQSHAGNGALASDLVNDEDPPGDRSPPVLFSPKFDHRVETILLEDEIDQILLALKKSQESEYRLAEETLHSQKDLIQNLYQQLHQERHELSRYASLTDTVVDALMDTIVSRVEQIKKELMKLKDMKEVSKGFGRTSRRILKEHFGLESGNQ